MSTTDRQNSSEIDNGAAEKQYLAMYTFNNRGQFVQNMPTIEEFIQATNCTSFSFPELNYFVPLDKNSFTFYGIKSNLVNQPRSLDERKPIVIMLLNQKYSKF